MTSSTRITHGLLILVLLSLLTVIGMLATGVRGGSLDPAAPPSPTMKTLGDIAPSWHRSLPSNDGDVNGCNSARFTCVFGDQAVLDNETGIVWQRSPSFDVASWNSKMNHCDRAASTGGRHGWRLPTLREFGSLLDTSPDSLPDGHPFLDVLPSGETETYFWTMMTDEAETEYADSVIFQPSPGTVVPGGATHKTSVLRAWCVRGGSGYDGAAGPIVVP